MVKKGWWVGIHMSAKSQDGNKIILNCSNVLRITGITNESLVLLAMILCFEKRKKNGV